MPDYDPNYIQPKDYVLISVKVLVQNPDKKILLLHRSKLSPGRKGWDFCGGTPDKNEDPTMAAIREAKEEAGIDISDIKPVATASFDNDAFWVVIGFRATTKSKNIELSWEHDEYRWVTKDEALKLELPDFFRKMIEEI